MIRISVDPPDFADWPQLLALLQASFAFMAGRIDPPSSLERLDAAGLARKAREETLIAAFERHDLVGCAFAREIERGLYIGKVAVHEHWRGQGIARALIAAAGELGRRKGHEFLELQARIELVENHRAFAALGFEKTAESAHPGYSRPTSITMRKPIDEPAVAAGSANALTSRTQ